MEVFDFGDFWEDKPAKTNIRQKIVEDKALLRKVEASDLHFAKIKSLHDLCPMPSIGEQWRIVTEKQFNAFDLIRGAVEQNIIEEMYLAIYRINEPIVDCIIDYINSGKIKKATFIISSFFNQTKKPEKWAKKLRDFCEKHPAQTSHIYTHNHSKVLAMHIAGGGYFVFEGSGNMSDNARIEQYLYENNEQSFNFHKSWMLELVKKYGQNGK